MRLILLINILMISACFDGWHIESDDVPAKLTAISSYSYIPDNGLIINLENLLAQNEPSIRMAVCRYPAGNEESDKRNCVRAAEKVKYKETKRFYLPERDLNELLGNNSTGELFVRFKDSHTRWTSYARCWHEDSMKIEKNNRKFKVKVTESGLTTYSCKISSI